MSSILSTSACGVGTQITSLPACPTCGSNVEFSCACAKTLAGTERTSVRIRRDKHDVLMTSPGPSRLSNGGKSGFARRVEERRFHDGCGNAVARGIHGDLDIEDGARYMMRRLHGCQADEPLQRRRPGGGRCAPDLT